MFGVSYVLEHVVSEANNRVKREMYEVYITDIGAGLATALGAKGVKRFYDILHPAKTETKTAQEITDDIVARAGLKRRKKGGIKHECNEPDGNAGA